MLFSQFSIFFKNPIRRFACFRRPAAVKVDAAKIIKIKRLAKLCIKLCVKYLLISRVSIPRRIILFLKVTDW